VMFGCGNEKTRCSSDSDAQFSFQNSRSACNQGVNSDSSARASEDCRQAASLSRGDSTHSRSFSGERHQSKGSTTIGSNAAGIARPRIAEGESATAARMMSPVNFSFNLLQQRGRGQGRVLRRGRHFLKLNSKNIGPAAREVTGQTFRETGKSSYASY
jgi:hypothetical protein